jgi:glyoxylase-like metal-dependent hydrolase (beta-lactamase superfamily II)
MSARAEFQTTGLNDDLLRWQIGDVRVTRVVEIIDDPSTMDFVLPQATGAELEAIPWLRPHFVDETGKMILSIHTFLVEAPGRRIVVDTCLGNDKERLLPHWNKLSTDFLNEIERAGFAPDRVDNVLCTHLHVDHVGWNTRWDGAQWVPTFPNARYLFARTEWEHWRDDPNGEMAGPVLTDSVRPILDAGLADLVETDHKICPEITLQPTPGHTPGHVSVWIRSRGEEAVITGDMVHHPCQLARPEWSAGVDVDPELSAKTRLALFEECAGRPVLVLGTHFATPTAGRIVRDGVAYRLEV